MGWYGCHKPAGQSYLDFFKGEIDADGSSILRRVLDGGVKNFCFYGIVADIDKATGATTHWVAVFPFKSTRDHWNTTYKPMSEDDHPYYYDVPEKIWKKIEQMVPVPTGSSCSGDWRKIVRERKGKPKLAAGVRFELAEPVKMSNGEVLSRFEYQGRGGLKAIREDGSLSWVTYRISHLNDREYAIL